MGRNFLMNAGDKSIPLVDDDKEQGVEEKIPVPAVENSSAGPLSKAAAGP